MSNPRAWILEQLDAERGRWMLWLPVALGLGIAVYYELPSEPALWLGPGLAAGSFVIAFFAPAGSFARAMAIGAVAASTGFGLVAWRTTSLAAPTLSRPLFSLNVEGRVADIQRLPDGVRVVLEAVRLRGNGVPPPESFSRSLRSVLRSVPVPEPNLNSMASLRASSMMSSMLSSTLWLKQAEPCGNSYGFSGTRTVSVSGSQCQLQAAPFTPY